MEKGPPLWKRDLFKLLKTIYLRQRAVPGKFLLQKHILLTYTYIIYNYYRDPLVQMALIQYHLIYFLPLILCKGLKLFL